MKASATTESPTPLLPAEELDHVRLAYSGLPKDVELVIAVTYDDRLEPVKYEIAGTPDGTLELTVPKIGAGGVARIGHKVKGSDELKVLGDPVTFED